MSSAQPCAFLSACFPAQDSALWTQAIVSSFACCAPQPFCIWAKNYYARIVAPILHLKCERTLIMTFRLFICVFAATTALAQAPPTLKTSAEQSATQATPAAPPTLQRR